MKKEIQIPFEGLYESVIDSHVDDYILNLFDFEGCGDTDLIPDSWYNHFGYNTAMINAIGAEYTSLFQEYLKEEFKIEIELTFKNVSSPQEYNFTTDRLFCEISDSDIAKLAKLASDQRLKEVISIRHTSRGGFASFYSNDFEEWQEKGFKEFDHNELQTLLIAAMFSQYDADECYLLSDSWSYFEENFLPVAWELWESATDNGILDTIVFNNMSQECQDLANAAYEEYEKEQKASL